MSHWNRAFNWGDKTVHSLEEQALKPDDGGKARLSLVSTPSRSSFSILQSRMTCTAGCLSRMFLSGETRPWTTANIVRYGDCELRANDSYRAIPALGSVPLSWRRGMRRSPLSRQNAESVSFFTPGLTECFQLSRRIQFFRRGSTIETGGVSKQYGALQLCRGGFHIRRAAAKSAKARIGRGMLAYQGPDTAKHCRNRTVYNDFWERGHARGP